MKTPKGEKTPKSERRRATPDTPNNNDWMCSQHFDPDVLVGWDCNSPETVRNIRRIQGDNCDAGISEIVKQLMDRSPDPDTPQPGGTPKLLARWKVQMENNNNQLLPRTPVRPKRRRGVSYSRRRKAQSDAMSRDLLHKLETALERQMARKQEEEAEKRAETDRKAENKSQASGDLSDSSLIRNMEVDNSASTTRASSRLAKPTGQETGVTKSASSTHKPVTQNDEDLWSDDELFEDDSFVIQATQLPPRLFDGVGLGMKRRGSADSDALKTKHPRQTFQIGTPKSVVPIASTSTRTVPIASTSTGISGNGGKYRSSTTNWKCVSSPPASHKSGASRVRNAPNIDGNLRNNRNNGLASNCVATTLSAGTARAASSTSSFSGSRNVSASCSSTKPGALKTNAPTKSSFGLPRPNINNNLMTAQSQISREKSNCDNKGSFTKQSSISDINRKSTSTVSGNVPFSQRTRSGQGTLTPMLGSSTLPSASRMGQVSSISASNNGQYKTKTSSTTSNVQSCLSSANNSQRLNLPRYANPAAAKTSTVTCAINKQSSCSRNTVAGTKCEQSAKSSLQFGVRPISTSAAQSGARPPSTSAAQFGARPSSTIEFDASLSEDILLQLTEPDELLDSQVFAAPARAQKKSDPPRDPPAAKNSAYTRTDKQVCDNKSTVSNTSSNVLKKDGGTKLVDKKQMVNSSLESHGQNKRFTFKASQKPGESRNSAVANNPSNKIIPVSNRVVPSNKIIPVSNRVGGRLTKEEPQTKKPSTAMSNEFSEDLFLSDDDGLTEPQILAMLDEAELMATQKLNNSQKDGSQKSNKSDSDQGQPRSSQGHTTCSPGQASSSPNKYSPAEIERKKQEALERRKKKIQVK